MDTQQNNYQNSSVAVGSGSAQQTVSATRKDYIIVAIIGFVSGLLVLPVLKNIKLSFLPITTISSFVIVVAVTVLSVFALWIAELISRKVTIIFQVAKFAATGVLNTLLDFGVLNLLIYLFAITSGVGYSIFKGASFIVANINSYFWNKYWTFSSKGEANTKEFGQFFAVSFVGFLVNTGIASLIVNLIKPIGGASPFLWANFGALVATLASLIWNFVGYKFLVFKKSQK